MIQRIQTIFLFLASAAGFGQLALPYASSPAPQAVAIEAPALADGAFTPTDNTGLLGLLLLSAVISLVAIFLYRNRAQQARITGAAALATVLLIFLIGFTLFQLIERVGTAVPLHYQAGLGLPVLSLVFQWLATRFIKKDEKLVRSMDRLR